jgi:type VI secretion system secreted protein VgrG
MPTYTQANRPLAIKTPLGQDVLLLTGFRGHEAISQLFNFQADLIAEADHEIHFDRIVGQNVTVELHLANQEKRYFNGLVKRFSQGGRDESFVHFSAEIVPKPWLLTKKVRSRIFQHLSVPDILRQVFAGLDVTYELTATYYQRDYCVQYRESDFNFASRLMEEEGIYYFFNHGDGSHQMVVTDVATQHPTVAGQSSVIYDEVSGGGREDLRITAWEKSQELRSGQYTLWDHCFELPDKHLEAKKKTTDSVTVGEVTHKLSVGGNDKLEIYDYPGGYAQRFDGIDRNGAPRPQDLQDLIPDSERTVKVRMEEETAASLEIRGASNCGQFIAGHQFTLKRHFDADGQYLLTRVEHDAHLDGDYRSDQASAFSYENSFTCTPGTLPYRPQRVTRLPLIAGIQTATVVGPSGEEIFCDKYGRVKVQFHWDREGKKDANSSCWLRVAQVWAGKSWGAFFWPRIGHEVVVVFEEGDPDQPLIIGSVYNADNMPPFELPKKNSLTGFKSASFRGNPHENFNGVIFDDTKGHEHLGIHSERHMSLNAEYDKVFHGGRHKGERVSKANIFTLGNLPFGGGSGGGFDDKDYTPVSHPRPGEVPGLNSTFVYGENLQVAVGLNHQLALGNNLQICINPLGLLAGVSSLPTATALPLAGMLGSGVGGNMQFTIGSSANFVLGQSFDINLGPPKIEIKGGPGENNSYGDHIPTDILCGVMGALVLVWVIIYGDNTDDNAATDLTRAQSVMFFQFAIDALLTAIMLIEVKLHKLSTDSQKAIKAAHEAADKSKETDALQDLLGFASGEVWLAMIAAPIAATGGEINS